MKATHRLFFNLRGNELIGQQLVVSGADSGSRTHDIRLETSDDNHFTISAMSPASRIPPLSQSVQELLKSGWWWRYLPIETKLSAAILWG